ncbi:MAG: hypothetical protein BHW44_07355 [Roseburia sp. 40_7]|nr:MAG: hypothetical protein BHW44_07355 [Roseburia sp. 40_7]
MEVKTFYEHLGMGYEDVSGRLGSDALIKKFVIKFLDDASFTRLRDGLQENDGEKAFRAAHTLNFDTLYKPCAEITEALRDGRITEGCNTLFLEVEKEYNRLTKAVRSILIGGET